MCLTKVPGSHAGSTHRKTHNLRRRKRPIKVYKVLTGAMTSPFRCYQWKLGWNTPDTSGWSTKGRKIYGNALHVFVKKPERPDCTAVSKQSGRHVVVYEALVHPEDVIAWGTDDWNVPCIAAKRVFLVGVATE